MYRWSTTSGQEFNAERCDDVYRNNPQLSDEEQAAARAKYERRQREECTKDEPSWGWACCCGVLWPVPLIVVIVCLILAQPPRDSIAPPGPTSSGGAMMTPAPTAAGDCCPQDPFVSLGGEYTSASPTLCDDDDYNCDDNDTEYACCYGVAEPVENPYDDRIIYHISNCSGPLSTNVNFTCGACSEDTVYPGWACESPIARKRAVLLCPDECEGETVETSPESPPELGECALFTDHCVGENGGDGERCCVHTRI